MSPRKSPSEQKELRNLLEFTETSQLLRAGYLQDNIRAKWSDKTTCAQPAWLLWIQRKCWECIPFSLHLHSHQASPLVNKVIYRKDNRQGFPGGLEVKKPPAYAGDIGSIPDLGRSHMPRSNWAHVPQLLSPHALEPVPCNKSTHPCNERKHSGSNEDPVQPKTN